MVSGGLKSPNKGSEFYFSGKESLSITKEPPVRYAKISIGIDDTDSAKKGMCTTFIATEIVRSLRSSVDVEFRDYPSLVRLNPQVPNKTRGNGALAIHLWADEADRGEILEIATDIVSEQSILGDHLTHPGIAIATGDSSPKLGSFYRRCLHRIVSKNEAIEIARSEEIQTVELKDGLGIIGAIAALGADFSGDHTYEIIAYRNPENRGRKRDIDEKLVLRLDREVNDTFYNYDYDNDKVCVVPASPCPVLFGIRGETPEGVICGYHILGEGEYPPAMVYKTNQHTDAHLELPGCIRNVIARSSVIVVGDVMEKPRNIAGGHVILPIGDRSGSIDCAAYEPTKQFREVVRGLLPGDRIRAFGSVRPGEPGHGKTINLEKIEILSLSPHLGNPSCPKCHTSMESMGRSAGYRCRKRSCGFRDPAAIKIEIPGNRRLETGFFEPPPVAWRHLYKPILRGTG